MRNIAYLCPVCHLHRQEFEAKSRDKLAAHLLWSHPQLDLVKCLVKKTEKITV